MTFLPGRLVIVSLGMILALGPCPLRAQVSYAVADTTLVESYDALPDTVDNTAIVWSDNSSLPGWYALQTGSTPSYATSSGGTAAGLLMMRASQGAEKALGSRTTGTTGNISYGIRINNVTGGALDRFQILFDGEQWRVGTAPVKTLVVEFSLDATSLATGTWTTLPSAAFATPHASASTASALDGNNAANRIANLTASATGIVWAPGADLWIRWTDTVNNGGVANPSFGIDNFRFSGGRSAGQRFPSDAGMMDVTAAPYNADPTGVADATSAIQAAINAAQGPDQKRRTIYLPNGTYRLTNSLVANLGWVTIQGESRDGVVLKLDDACVGFTNVASPRPVISTLSLSGPNSNVQFMCNLYDLTIDVGAGNPGAIGLRYVANNQASLRDVVVRSSDPSYAGYCGIDFELAGYPGPALLKRVGIIGFEHALRAAGTAYGFTAEHLDLSHQRAGGIRNNGLIVSLRGITSINTVPAIQNIGGDGMVTLVDSDFSGGSPSASAIENSAHLFAREITTSGYQSALKAGSTVVPGATITEYTSSPAKTLTGTPLESLNLPIEETPEITWDAPDTWINVLDYGATNNDNTDDSSAIQAAIDAATATHRTIYFPHGEYVINQTVVVRGYARHLFGFQAEIRVGATLAGTTSPVFRLVDGHWPVIQIERFYGSWWNSRQRTSHWFTNERAQDTVLRNIFLGNGQAYIGTNASGKTYFEDVCALCDFVGIDGNIGVTPVNPVPAAQPQMIVGPQEEIWARQLNLEARQQKLLVDGGMVWMLGFKTEQPGQLVEARNGATMEMLGGALLNREDVEIDVPVFLNAQANISLVAGEINKGAAAVPFGVIVREASVGGDTDLDRSSLPAADSGRAFRMPLYVSYGIDRPVVSVRVSDFFTREGEPGVTFTFHRTGATAEPLAITYLVSGTATPGADTSSLPGLLTIPPGADSISLNLTATDDSLPEMDESFTITISETAEYYVSSASPSATVDLLDNDILSSVAIARIQPVDTTATVNLSVHNPADVAQTFTFIGPSGGGNPSWQTSDQAGGPAYDWIEISQTGSRVMRLEFVDDGYAEQVPIGFEFPFYGATYTRFNLCSNGFINFGAERNDYRNYNMPGTTLPRGMIAWMWDDLYVDGPTAAIYTQLLDSDTFVIQFDNLRHYSNRSGRVTGQIVLKSSGEIILQYKSFTNPGSEFSYTIGVQNMEGSLGVTASSGATNWTGKAIRFRPAQAAVYTTPQEVTVPAGATAQVPVTLNSSSLSNGLHSYTLLVSSNAPGLTDFAVPVSLTVGTPTPIQSWRQTYFDTSEPAGDAADLADPDGDGFANLVEYGLGGDPLAPTSQPVESQIFDSKLQISFTRARSEINYVVQASDDLVTWNDLVTNPGTVGQSVTFTDSVLIGSQPRRFLRLKVVAP